MPNERRRAGITHPSLADDTDTGTLRFLDDHARYAASLPGAW